MRTTVYLHGSKESNWEIGKKLGLSEEAQLAFRHACTEVKVELEVGQDGIATMVAVDEMKLVHIDDKAELSEAIDIVEMYLDQEADFLAEECREDMCDEDRVQLAAIRKVLTTAKRCLT